MSNQLAITSLGRTVAMFIANHITSDNAIKMLKKALELQSTYTTTNPTTDDVISKCVLILARNFSDLVNTKGESIFNALPINVVLDVLRHGSLAVEAECHVYAVVCTYLGNVPQSASVDYHELATTLYETVRFPYLDYDHLSHAMQNPWVPRSMLAEGVVYRLLNFEVSPSVHVESLPSRIAPRPAFARIFEYSYDFDKRGVLYYLATNGCVDEWRNPAATKRIKVTASSTEKGSCQTIGDLVPSEWWTADVPASWVQVALQHGFVVVPTYYSLRHGSNSKHDCLRNWVLQGSNDGNSWTTLRRHTNDMSINSNYATHSWPVQGTEPFQFFRVLQTGRNSSNHNFLSLSGFELYGDLHRLTAAASASTLQLAPTPAPTPVSSNSSITGTSPPQAPSGLTLGKKSS
ncbi:E3 ubiquitin-protein ligase HECTD1 [Pelomyxa schiedti]|nr:E3 ubiquitin-protein ligase HECTD1 [Pelomyxa schiedti]